MVSVEKSGRAWRLSTGSRTVVAGRLTRWQTVQWDCGVPTGPGAQSVAPGRLTPLDRFCNDPETSG